MTPGTHKYARAARSFCFVTTEKGDQQIICILTTMPCVQRSLYLNEMTNNFSNIQVEVPEGVCRTRDVLERCMRTCGKAAGIQAERRSRAQKEASAKEVRGYYKQFAEAKTPGVQILGWKLSFRSCWSEEGQTEKLCNRKMGAHHQDGQTR